MQRSQLDPVRQRRLLDAGAALVSGLDFEDILQSLVETARELTGARYAALGVLDERRESLERFITVGIDEETRAAIGDLPRGHGILGVVIDDPQPLRLHDIGQHPRSYGLPLAHPPMASFLGVPVLIRGEAFGNLYLTEKIGADAFDDADEEAATVLATWAASAIENARLYRSERAQRAELERTVRTLETTTEIARAVSGETRLDRLLELIAKRARALVSARSLLILLPDGDELVVAEVAGEADRDLVGTRVPRAGSATGAILEADRPERVADVSGRLRFALGERITAKAALLAPMSFHGQHVGVLAAFDRLDGDARFTAEDERLVVAFTASAASAIGMARNVAAENLRRSIAASEAERARWSRELHDETLQELAALKVGLASARRSGKPERLDEATSQAIDQIDGVIGDLRALISELRPAALDALGAGPAIEALVARIESRSGLVIDAQIDLACEEGREPRRLAPDVEAAVYRTTQEALTNVLKHAGASRATVRVSEDEATVSIVVSDDGLGFDLAADRAGFGLIGMRERLASVGGRLELSSQPGTGTTLRAWVPARRDDTPGAALKQPQQRGPERPPAA